MFDPSAIPAPVHTQEVNDCVICATQYVCRWFGLPDDRGIIKCAANWTPARGTGRPLGLLREYGLQAPQWCARDQVFEDDGVTVLAERNLDAFYGAFVEQLDVGRIGLATIGTPNRCHEVVVVGAEPETESLWIVCSLRGIYKVLKREYFTGPDGRADGICVTWVWKEGAR